VTTRFCSLRDHQVAAGFDGSCRVAHSTAHVRDEHSTAVAEVDDLARYSQTGNEQGCTPSDDGLDLLFHVSGECGQKVHAEGAIRSLTDIGNLSLQAIEAQGCGTYRADSPGITDGDDEI
jgi:hypothetical protein